MQKIMLDTGLLEDARFVEAPARAGWGWLFLLRHCNATANGGLISQVTTRKQWARLLPEDADIDDVVRAGLVEDDGHGNWRVLGYDLGAERKYHAQSNAAAVTNEKRWGTSRNRLATIGERPSVSESLTNRQNGRQTGRQTDRPESDSQYARSQTGVRQESDPWADAASEPADDTEMAE